MALPVNLQAVVDEMDGAGVTLQVAPQPDAVLEVPAI